MAVVAFRPSGLGGFLTAVPAFRALQTEFGEDRVVVAAPRSLWPLAGLAGTNLVNAEPGEALGSGLRRADVFVNLQDRGPDSTRLALGTRPLRLLAFEHSAVPETAGMPRWRSGEGEAERWCRLLSESGIPADPEDVRLPMPAFDAPEIARGATVLHPGPGWPAERFAEVARSEIDAGREVVVTGGPGEVGLANEIARRVHLSRDAVLAGRTDLLRLAALVAYAGRVVCGDSGVGHLANAFGTPSVTLLGESSRLPLVGRGLHRALSAGESLSPSRVLAELAALPAPA